MRVGDVQVGDWVDTLRDGVLDVDGTWRYRWQRTGRVDEIRSEGDDLVLLAAGRVLLRSEPHRTRDVRRHRCDDPAANETCPDCTWRQTVLSTTTVEPGAGDCSVPGCPWRATRQVGLSCGAHGRWVALLCPDHADAAIAGRAACSVCQQAGWTS